MPVDSTKLIGTVSAIHSNELTVTGTGGTASAANTFAKPSAPATANGTPCARLGAFVSIEGGGQTLIGTISAIRQEHQSSDGAFKFSATTSSSGRQVMDVQLIGTVKEGKFNRGVGRYPTIGESVHLADTKDLQSIFSHYRSGDFSIGNLTQIDNERLYVEPNKFFSKHVALFGSTGSGKSCTTASILQKVHNLENTHVIMLDLHGEYAPAFAGTGNIIRITDLELPYWLMNYDELVEVLVDETETSAQNQMMVLKEAVLDSKRGKNMGMKEFLTVDTPAYFDFLDVSARMRTLDTERTLAGKEGAFYGQFTRFLVRLESKLMDKRYEFLFKPKTYKSSETLPQWLSQIFGFESGKRITVIDLSRVPFDVINVLVSLLGRVIFDFNLWNKSRQDFPVLIVFEEAHTYLSMAGRSQAARKTVERIAKEGRKYGVSCMIVSQRPAEISETITAQCNNFIALRLLNPNDQAYVRKLLPEALSNLMDVLPTLQQGEAFIIGDAVPLPSRVMIDMPSPTPASGDVRFFEKWQKKDHDTNVQEVVDNWWKQKRE